MVACKWGLSSRKYCILIGRKWGEDAHTYKAFQNKQEDQQMETLE